MTNNLDKDVTITFTRKQLVETILAIHSSIATYTDESVNNILKASNEGTFDNDFSTLQKLNQLHQLSLKEVLNKITLATETKEDK